MESCKDETFLKKKMENSTNKEKDKKGSKYHEMFSKKIEVEKQKQKRNKKPFIKQKEAEKDKERKNIIIFFRFKVYNQMKLKKMWQLHHLKFLSTILDSRIFQSLSIDGLMEGLALQRNCLCKRL